MVRIYGIELPDENTFDSYKEALKTFLPAEVLAMALKFRFIEGVQRKMLGQALLRMAVIINYGIRSDKLTIAYGNAQKPYLLSHPHIHFNISHSGRWVVVAVSEREVGIDVERVKKVNLGIAERFFSEMEKHQLFSLPEAAQMDYFFDLWTLKESFLKAIGTGLTKPLKSFTVVKNHNGFSLSENDEMETIALKQIEISENYKLAVCSCGDSVDETLCIVELPQIIDFLKGK